jgi:hypothetical protein
MVRRSSPEPDTGGHARMMDTLAKHSKSKINGTGSSAPTGDASVSGGVGDGQINAGVAPVRTLPSLAEQQEALRKLSGAPPLPDDPRDPAPPIKALTQRPVVPQGYVAEPPQLEWLKAVNHAGGEATQLSTGGAYRVSGRRTPYGLTYTAGHGLDSLGVFKIAQEARDCCQAHYLKACES